MPGGRIKNLAEHYLGSLRFSEASSQLQNRFLDEVCRRYVRDADKLYVGDDKYVLTCEYDPEGDYEQLRTVSISVFKVGKFANVPYFEHGKKRRICSEGFVSVGALVWPVFSIELNYSPAGTFESVTVENSGNVLGDVWHFLLNTQIESIRENGLSLSWEGFVKTITNKELSELRATAAQAVSKEANVWQAIRGLRKVLGSDIVLEPSCQIIGLAKVIENK